MSRKGVEQFTASLAIFLLMFLTTGFVLLMADQVFNWDIFPPYLEKVIGFILIVMAVVIFSSVLVNVMLNLGIIAKNSEKLSDVSDKRRGRQD